MTWCPERFPNPKEMCDTLHHKLHVKVMASIWPTVGDDSELARELDAKKLRFEPLHWITKKARVYDAYSEEGRSIYFKHMKKGLLDVGVDAMWMDGTEVETRSSCKRPQDMVRDIKENGINAMGDFTRYLNSYSLMTTRGCYEGQRATANKRVLTLTRSAWAGQQRYAALPWSGDTTASWQCLKDQIAGGLSASLSGLPYWTQDTGGFFLKWVLREKNKEYQELLARWNQFGIFNPVYRWHSSGVDREPWRFRESAPEMYDSYRKAAELRYQLLPYIYSLAWQTTVTGAPMTRPVVMDFPGSKGAKDEQTAFLFGPALLTQPVTRPMYHDDAKLPASLIPAEALAPGVRTEYFADTRLKRIVSNCVEPNIDFSWPGPPLVEWPQGLENGENFSCRVTGVLTVPEAGEYRIGITGDSGFRLKFGKRMVINEWRNNTLRTVTTALLLKKDEKLPFEIEYCHSTGPRTLQMVWKTPSMLLKERAEKQDIDNRETTHLPEGADWYDFWSDRFLSGGTEAVTECTLDRFPLFVRAGSILPLGPADLKYATEKPGAPLEIRIYAGADATFEWYEDDNETYDYERGLRATAAFAWDDAAKCLRIGKRQGSFPGMIAERDFRAILIGKDSKRQEQSVRYRGEEVSIQFNKGK